MKITTKSKEETQAIAQKLGESLTKGCTILLFGELGAGKTTFVQGLAKGLEITDKVNSPTFVIMKEYVGRLPLIHIDAYRLEGISQDLGFDEYETQDSVKVIEWPQYYIEDTNLYNRLTILRLDEDNRELVFNFVDQELLEVLR